MKKQDFKLTKLLLFVVPLLLGTVGFILSGESLSHALFISVCLYGLEYQDPPVNILVELARWTAPLATAGSILLFFGSVRKKLHNYICYHSGHSVAVYGPDREKNDLLKQLGPKGIDGGSALTPAQCYIFLWNDSDNLAFYCQHEKDLKDTQVYLLCRSIKSQAIFNPRLHLICPEETAARLYWKQRCLYESSACCDHKLSVVFLGFGKLGEELLTYALQDNIFHPDQRIAYHIFGDGSEFLGIHQQISLIRDPVIFHDEPWYQQIPLINEARRVIVLTQEHQTSLLDHLLLATTGISFDVFAARDGGAGLLSGQDRLYLYQWEDQYRKLEHIFDDALCDRAKRINLWYKTQYDHIEPTEENKESTWQALDTFTRYSNISAADHYEICLQILSSIGQIPDADRLSPKVLELLSELEHIRWCRYHYLNNWTYGKPENGKNKDMSKRIHTDLVPYEDLTEEEKKKDRDNVLVLLAVDGKGKPHSHQTAL